MGATRLPMIAAAPYRPLPPIPVAGSAPEHGRIATTIRQHWSGAPKLSDILTPEANSYGGVRLILALAVLLSHAVFLYAGRASAEPLVDFGHYSLGQYAVQGFFILSGVLVARSLAARADVVAFARARALRILPGLIVCVLATALVAGPALSALPLTEYFHTNGVATYILATLSLSTGSAHLPGLFEFNPAAGLVNQSLWTLKYEVACYALLAAAGWTAFRFRIGRPSAVAVTYVWAALMLFAAPSLRHGGGFIADLTYFVLFFGTGVAAFLFRRSIRLSVLPLLPLAILFVALRRTDLAEIASAGFIGYGILLAGTARVGALRSFANDHDYSYGTYIYGYPVTQVVLQLWPDLGLLPLVAAATALTLMLAALSWTIIESPALAYARLRNVTPDRAARSRSKLTPPTRPDAAPLPNATPIAAVVARATPPAAVRALTTVSQAKISNSTLAKSHSRTSVAPPRRAVTGAPQTTKPSRSDQRLQRIVSRAATAKKRA